MKKTLLSVHGIALLAFGLLVLPGRAAVPAVSFTWPTNTQVVTDLAAMTGVVADGSGDLTNVVFSLREVDLNGGPGRWWNGARYQTVSTNLAGQFSGTNWTPAPGLSWPQLNSGQGYELTVTARDAANNTATAQVTAKAAMTELSWDPGQTPLGTVVLSRPNTNGGNYWFKISPPTPSVGVWRTALNVQAGEADVYLSQGAPPAHTNSYAYGSRRIGSDGFVLHSSQFNPGQDWYLLVYATTNAQWNLVAGDAYVHNLGALAADASSSTQAVVGAESMIFFQTTIPADTLAWQLWLQGAPNTLYVRKSSAPHPASYDLVQNAQMLVVPPYLASGTFNGTYFIAVPANPGTVINLDSRKQPVFDLAFSSQTNVLVTATNFPYVTYRVQVPVQQIAWQMNLTPSSGNPAVAVRRDQVPNEFRNDAFSETPQGVGASVSMVPPPPASGSGAPGLSDGTFYVTVYSGAPFACSFANINPVITDVPFVFNITNDAPARAGWRYYRVGNIAEQLGTLGWELLLARQAPGSEIAIRRNAVPGRWLRRNWDNNYYTPESLGYVDCPDGAACPATGGFLQSPGHQADIWYLGVYMPTQALENFQLTGQLLTGLLTPFDGAGSSVTVTNEPSGKWKYFRVDVPADTNLLGWDVRLVGVIQGAPQLVVSRDTLPTGLGNMPWWGWPYGRTNWPSGSQWANADWLNCSTQPMMAMSMRAPLEPGTYYVGVIGGSGPGASYTFQSRGIGLTGYALPVRTLEAATGEHTNTLAVGEGDYYRIVVPPDQPDWKLRVHLTSGEAMLKVHKDALPISPQYPWGSYESVYEQRGGQWMIKPGDEQWCLLPPNGSNALTAGTYYAVVVSQGQNPTNSPCTSSHWGTNTATYTIQSTLEPVTVLPGTLSLLEDLVWTNTQAAGELKLYQFHVPEGVVSLEVRLEDRVGDPVMFLNRGTMPTGVRRYDNGSVYDPYGNHGGTNYVWQNSSLITVVNSAGTYSLTVKAAGGSSPDASYVLRVRAVLPPFVAFDDGASAVSDQQPGEWRFFRVDVPSNPNLLGWDLRLIDVLEGRPRMVVCRDRLPTSLENQPLWYWLYGATNWPGTNQWVATDWFNCNDVPVLVLGLGCPLEPGTYFIGVQDPDHTTAYTIRSRGIGLSGYSIPVRDLDPASGRRTATLPVLEGDYYRVTIPHNVPDWKLRVQVSSGEALLKVQHEVLPISPQYIWGNYESVYDRRGGQWMIKPGDEQWALLPRHGSNEVVAGTYYAVVVSQGQNLTNSTCGSVAHWGTNTASYTIESTLEPVQMLPETLAYGSDLLVTNTQAAGEAKFYQFNVPSGVASIEVRLEDRSNNPVMYLNNGAIPTGTRNYQNGAVYDLYGNFGGTNYAWRDPSLITVVNPSGPYSLSVHASTTNGSSFADTPYTYVLRVRALPPPQVAFDGGTYVVDNQPPQQWQYFRVDVPSDPNLLGWDVRLRDVTNGRPRLVVCRDTLPSSLDNQPWWGWPYGLTNWPSGNQWVGSDWTGCESIPVLALGLNCPLEPGTYFIGVQDPDRTNSYTLQSRGIGLSGYSIPVHDLDLASGSRTASLLAGEGDYYRIVVPPGTPNWKLQLQMASGEALLKVHKDALPMSPRYPWGAYGSALENRGGQWMMKEGDEQWMLLPPQGGSALAASAYYAVVVSQGRNITNVNCSGHGSGWGTNTATYTLRSSVAPVVSLPPTLAPGQDLLYTNTAFGGEMQLCQFLVPSNVPSLEVRLENRIGNPLLCLVTGAFPASLHHIGGSTLDTYGNYGGITHLWHDGNLITIPNVTPGLYSLTVMASIDYGSGDYPNAAYTLRLRLPAIPTLTFSPELNGGGVSNTVSGILADNQRAFFLVDVPAQVAGAPVLGWKLDLTARNGTPSVRVRPGRLPDDVLYGGTSPFHDNVNTIVPPYLTPGTWYVEVKGGGATDYTLASLVITTNTLNHPLWVMPAQGQTSNVPGLVFPVIGDSGVSAGGTALPGDQGIDLNQGKFDYYAVMIPSNNAALLRTELQAISGNPNLYLRAGAAPTLFHRENGEGGILYDRALTGNTTEYGNWVPLIGKTETELTNGLWVLAVEAAGNANVRYRLILSCGNTVTNGLVQDLALDGGAYVNQNLNGGDWRYYRVQIPTNAPNDWKITWTRSLGSARLFLRDSAPPGDGHRTADYSDPGFNPGPWQPHQQQNLESWAGDGKNQGPYPRFDTPGMVTLTTPPIRPGSVYYLGFWSPVDTTFSVSSYSSGGTIDVTNTLSFLGGFITNTVPGNSVVRYRMEVPADATRLQFVANNPVELILSLEQGTVAQAGGPAHWTSYWGNDRQNTNTANAGLNQVLSDPKNWPWLPGYTYYLTVTNTAPTPKSFGLTMGTPSDLAPVAFLAPATVTSTRPNPQIQVIWGVTNQGAVTVTNHSWYDRVWFSTNGQFDSQSQYLGEFIHYGPLPAGGSYWNTNLLTLPINTSRSYTLFLQVNNYNQVYESRLDNNLAAPAPGVFTHTPPDLGAVSIQGPSTVVSMQSRPSVQVVWCGTNHGPSTAEGGWHDRIWCSTNGQFDGASISAGDFYISQTVPAGGIYWMTNNVTLPLETNGSFAFFVQTDVNNGFNDFIRTNQVAGPSFGAYTLMGAQTVLANGVYIWNDSIPVGNSITVASNAVLILSGNINISGRLTNAGIIRVPGGSFTLNGCSGEGVLINLPGGVIDLQTDGAVNNNCNGTLDNQGALRKTGGYGQTWIYPKLLNSGLVEAQTGTLVINAGSSQGGAFHAQAGATINLANPYTLGGGCQFVGAGTNLWTSSSLYFDGTIVSSNVVVAGSTLNVTNGLLQGSMAWSSGTLSSDSALTIATNGTLVLAGTSTKYLNGFLTNAGVIRLAGTGAFYLSGYNGGGTLFNLASGLIDLQVDASIQWYYGYTNECLINHGTVRKSGGAGTASLGMPFFNFGTLEVQSGTVSINNNQGGGNGLFLAQAGATLQMANTYALGDGSRFTGAGTNLWTGGAMGLSGSITSSNVVLAGSSLDATNAVLSGVLTWNNGSINSGSTLTIAPDGTLVLASTSSKFNSGLLTNAGTVRVTGTGTLYLAGSSGGGTLVNLASGLIDLQADTTIQWYYGYLTEAVINQGTLRKSGGAGTTTLGMPFFNDGTLEVQSGTVSINNNKGSGHGVFLAQAGATVQMATSYALGHGSRLLGAGTNLWSSGSVGLIGSITSSNVVLAGANLDISNAVFQGVFTWAGGAINSGSILTLASNSSLVLTGGSSKYQYGTLTNAGTLRLGGTADLQFVGNSGGGRLVNLPGGLVDFTGDLSISRWGYASEFLLNQGTVRKSGGVGTSTVSAPLTNHGVLDAQSGILRLTGAYNLTGGELRFGLASTNTYGRVALAGDSVLTGTVSAQLNNGFLPVPGDAFAVLTYASATGTFTSLALPSVVEWQTRYGATAFSLLVPVPLRLINQVWNPANGRFTASLQAEPGRSYWLESRTNLGVPPWIFVTGVTNVTGPVQFQDVMATNRHKFYRVQSAPYP